LDENTVNILYKKNVNLTTTLCHWDVTIDIHQNLEEEKKSMTRDKNVICLLFPVSSSYEFCLNCAKNAEFAWWVCIVFTVICWLFLCMITTVYQLLLLLYIAWLWSRT